MDKLISEIQLIIADYRKDEGINIDNARIKGWIEQFDPADHIFLLTELKNILAKRYISKIMVYEFLKDLISKLTKDNNYQDAQEFLANCSFQRLQAQDKSQSVLLNLLPDLLQKEFNFDIKNCGIKSTLNHIYIDDILSTGNKLFNDILKWASTTDGTTSNYDLLMQKKINLNLYFIFLHNKNFEKTQNRLFHQKIGNDFWKITKVYRHFEIENRIDQKSNLDFIYPIEELNEKLISDYKAKIENEVNNYHKINPTYNRSPIEFYRNPNLPAKETLFSNPDSRNRFEKILLKKGIEILNRAAVTKPNIRSLGYDLPSHNSFGFGTLAFTYRNVPNNTPLVFWYSGGGFSPLFIKNPTSQK